MNPPIHPSAVIQAEDFHLIVRTPHRLLLDTICSQIEVEDHMGRFDVVPGEPALAALVPSEIVVRRRDGSEAHLDISWGSLTAVGRQVRIIVENATISETEAMPIAV